jgi:hypothetical protein
VLAHAAALCSPAPPEGVTACIDADLRQPQEILRRAANILDFTQPVALLLMGVLEFITDDEHAHAIARELTQALPAGSHLF